MWDLFGGEPDQPGAIKRADDASVGKAPRVGGPVAGTAPAGVTTSDTGRAPGAGLFDDLAKLFAPVTGAASDLWDAVTHGAAKDPARPKPAAPELPATDEAWQATMAEARAGLEVTQRYSVPTRALNPSLLMAIRISHVDPKSQFYDVLTNKGERTKGKAGADLTPGRLAYRLGTELEARAEAEAAMPTLLATKLALVDGAAPGGAIAKSKSAGGNLRVKLRADLGKPAQAAIDAWFHAHYHGSKLVAEAPDVADLRRLVQDSVAATAADPARDERIATLRADIVACEARVRGLLRARATDTKAAKARALWTQLADLADAEGVFVDRAFESYRIEAEDGTVTTLAPVNAISVNFLNPGGFKNGGGTYSDATIDSVLADEYTGDGAADQQAATKKFIHTLNRNEGGPASMNTWDGEIVSAGPGLSGSGRLQSSMAAFKAEDPGGFQAALGKFGVDIVKPKRGNPYFTVRVPRDPAAIPPALRDQVTPGELIIGSATTGASKGSAAYEECRALRYISKDPVLMSRFMFAGQHAYQRFLIKEAAQSMHKAEAFSFTAGARRVEWTPLIQPLGADWLAATEAVIAYRYHASAAIFEDLRTKAAAHYTASFGDRDPALLTDDERKQIGRFVAGQLKPGKYAIYRAQFPSVASDVFPAAKGDDEDDDQD
jgi:hypothetical protein